MFSEEINFLAARLELQASDVHDGDHQHYQRWRRRQRPENEEDRERVDRVANDAKWSAENQLRFFFWVDTNSPGPPHLPPARKGGGGRTHADCRPNQANHGPRQIVRRVVKSVA